MDEVKDEIIVPAGRVVCHRDYEDIDGLYVAIRDITDKTLETAQARCIERIHIEKLSYNQFTLHYRIQYCFAEELVRMGLLIAIQFCDLSLASTGSFEVTYRHSDGPDQVDHHWPRRNP